MQIKIALSHLFHVDIHTAGGQLLFLAMRLCENDPTCHSHTCNVALKTFSQRRPEGAGTQTYAALTPDFFWTSTVTHCYTHIEQCVYHLLK